MFEMRSKFLINEPESYNILVYNKFDDNLKEKWEILEKSSSCYLFQKYAWNEYWYKTFNSLYNFYIVVVEIDGTTAVIFPLCINKKGFLKVLQFVGGNQADYLNPVISDQFEVSSKIWRRSLGKIEVKYDLILLEKIPEFIRDKKNTFLSAIETSLSEKSFGLKLPQSYTEFENSLKRSFRNDNRRNAKRLNEVGHIEFKTIAANISDHAEFDNYIGVSIEQKARRLRNYMGNKIFENEFTQEFYKKSYLINDSNIHLHYTVLCLNDITVLATHWGFYDDERYYFLLPTMEGKEWYRYSCGKMLIDHLINFSLSKRIKYFDFTNGDENYKKDWCNNEIQLFVHREPKSVKGFIYIMRKNLIEHIKKNKYAKTFWRSLKSYLVHSRKRN